MRRPDRSTSSPLRRHRRRLAFAGGIATLALLVGVGRPGTAVSPVLADSSTPPHHLGVPVPGGARMIARDFDLERGESLLVVDLSGDTPMDWRDLRIVWRRPPLPGVIVATPVEPVRLPSGGAPDHEWRRLLADHRVKVEVFVPSATSE